MSLEPSTIASHEISAWHSPHLYRMVLVACKTRFAAILLVLSFSLPQRSFSFFLQQLFFFLSSLYTYIFKII